MSEQPDVVNQQDAETEDPIVAALLRERESYVVRGLDERVAQVDEQIRLRDPGATAAPKRRRTTPQQQTR